MSRLLAAFAASLTLAAAARAQDAKKAEPELDAKTKAAIQREVEKAKEDIRNEVRAELQGAQSAAEFLGAVAEGPKLEFLELDGYLRMRGQLMVNLDLSGVRDASGHTLFPVPLQNPGEDSLATANMRFRLEPTLNVSEHVRVRAQLDFLDNHVLGSSTPVLSQDSSSPYPVPFYGSTRLVATDDPRLATPYVSPKRIWAEVQTPVGLLSFGRMPSAWGLGLLTHAGGGLDDDLGDTVDRLQFALPPVTTPLGRITFVPMLDFDSEGVLHDTGTGQPFDAESGDDAHTWAVKAARIDTPDEIRRKLDRNERSVNYGAYYAYRTQRWFYPGWDSGTPPTGGYEDTANAAVHRSSYLHLADLWFRWLAPRLRVEAELVGVYGSVGNPSDVAAAPEAKLLVRQWGGAVVADWQASPNKVSLGGEIGIASGDDAPGFGNDPSRVQTTGGTGAPGDPTPYGSVEGAQWRPGSDRTIRNFRFNPAYRVDEVLFRYVLGGVTDAVYVKPTLRWSILPGLALDAQIVYSRALFAESTPSADASGNGGSANLGLEADATLNYTSGDGFRFWGTYGVLQPLSGLSYQDAKVSRAHFMQFGLAARF